MTLTWQAINRRRHRLTNAAGTVYATLDDFGRGWWGRVYGRRGQVMFEQAFEQLEQGRAWCTARAKTL